MSEDAALSADNEVLRFLLTRRSRPVRMLGAPWPDRAALTTILTAAARSPDHGKLEPWRFIVLGARELDRLAALAESIAAARTDLDPARAAKDAAALRESRRAIAVVSSPVPSEKVPEIEQLLSAGAVCLAALNAALAAGWGACWLTGWMAHDRRFLEEGLGLAAHERLAGFIHIGTARRVPPERPRPDLARITDWRLAPEDEADAAPRPGSGEAGEER